MFGSWEIWGDENRKKKVKEKKEKRFKANKLFLNVFSNLFHLLPSIYND